MSRTLATTLSMLAMLAACGGGDGSADTALPDTSGAVQDSAPPSAADITPAMVALGDSIFHGRTANGICYTCHGMDAGGVTGLGPSLIDGEWLHGDGSYGAVVQTVAKGVTQPIKHQAPMPPMGGATLTDAQLAAVGAYVFSLTHPEVPQAPR